MTIGERIKRRRKQLGMNAETVARLLGVSPATIYRYEKGEIEKLNSEKLKPIAEILRTTPAELMGWDADDSATDAQTEQINQLYSQLTPENQKLAADFLAMLLDKQ